MPQPLVIHWPATHGLVVGMVDADRQVRSIVPDQALSAEDALILHAVLELTTAHVGQNIDLDRDEWRSTASMIHQVLTDLGEHLGTTLIVTNT
jgi:hypothetical protein